MSQEYNDITYTLYPDPDTQWNPERAYQMVQTTLTLLPHCAFQFTGYDYGVVTQVIDFSNQATGFDKDTLKAVDPTASIRADTIFSIATLPYYSLIVPFKAFNTAENPLLYVDEINPKNDPLSNVFQALANVEGDDQVRLTLYVKGSHKPLIHKATSVWNVFQKTRQMNDPSRWYMRQPTTYEQVIESKQMSEWFECYLMLEIMCHSKERTVQIAENVTSQLLLFDRNQPNQPRNGLKVHDLRITSTYVETKEDALRSMAFNLFGQILEAEKSVERQFKEFQMFLQPREIATIWHLPHDDFTSPKVAWKPKRPEMSKAVAENDEGITLGGAFYDGEMKLVYLRDEDRTTHMNIIGRSGVGKSTLMHQLITKDIEAGNGVAVIDPHGDLVKSILRTSIPEDREDDVIVLDLARPEYPIPLNLFAGAQSYGAIGRIVSTLESVYAKSGVRMDKFLRAGIQALQHVPNATMRDLYRFLTDVEFRGRVMENIEDDLVFEVWQNEYHLLSPSQQRLIRDPILSRISPFYANPYLYPSLCHPERIDIGRFIQDKKIVLLSLGVSGEIVPEKERNLLGALVISLIQMIGMNPDRERTPFYIYIDEVQNFVTNSLEVVFSEARKYKLSMTVANQFLNQLSQETMQGIMGNVGATIIFRSNVEDARAVGSYVHPQFTTEDLVNQDRYTAVVKMMHKGETQNAFFMACLSPYEVPADAEEREKRIRQRSAKQYTPKSREDVLKWLNERYPSTRRTVIPPPSNDDEDTQPPPKEDQENQTPPSKDGDENRPSPSGDFYE